MTTVKEKEKEAFKIMKEEFGYKNIFESPRLKKVVISSGVGSAKDKGRIELVQDRLSFITGQKASARPSRKSIAAFKVRQGDSVGYQVTLRGIRMYAFMDKLLTIALPRTRDFRGLSRGSVDEMGNYTIGIKEHTIFPEFSNEELKDVFGLSISIVTTAKTPKEAIFFLEHIGLPLKKEESKVS